MQPLTRTKMNLFIDANIYLDFYDFSNDDLDELHKLVGLIEADEVTLLLPEQTIDEFWRNHEANLKEALSEFRKGKIDNRFPQICKPYTEYRQMREAIQAYEEAKRSLLNKLEGDIESGNLKADSVIGDLFEAARLVERSDDIVKRAKLRYDLGNPPGKDGSYGDAVCWESLLSVISVGESLCIVSDDKDFKSKTDPSKMSPFLIREWEKSGRGELTFYERLSLFLKDKFSTIHVAHETDKDILIQQLSESGNFQKTHAIVDKLSKYSSFSDTQANDILSAAVSNSQVRWIITDEDVADLLKSVIQAHRENLDPDNLSAIDEALGLGWDLLKQGL